MMIAAIVVVVVTKATVTLTLEAPKMAWNIKTRGEWHHPGAAFVPYTCKGVTYYR